MKLDDAVLCRGGAVSLPVRGARAGRLFTAQDWLAEEVPVALEFNGISHAVMLATPLDLEDFALGFALSEGILQDRHELYDIEEQREALGITMRMRVAGSAFARLKHSRRSMAGRTGCGLCGTESLAHVARALPSLRAGAPLHRLAVANAMTQLRALQPLQQATGSVHAAAWCSVQGDVVLLREDVGRHNALDKLIGVMAGEVIERQAGFIAITSRASFEMVQKTAVAGVAVLAAVSAATSLAATTAEQVGMTLIGFARDDDVVVYTHPERLVW